MNYSKKSTLILDHFLLILISALIFFFIPMYMVNLSPQDFSLLDKQAQLVTAFTYSCIFTVFLLAVYWMLYVARLKSVASFCVIFTFFWVSLAGYLFPLVKPGGMIDPIDMPINTINILIVFILSMALTVLMKTKMSKYVSVFFVVFLLSCIIPDFINKQTQSINYEKRDKFAKLSTENNIIVLSLDGLPGESAYNVIQNSSLFKEDFKDFTLFKNVISSSPATLASIAGELNGNINLKKVFGTETAIVQSDKKRILINRDDFETYTYMMYNFFNLDKSKTLHFGELSENALDMRSKINFTINFYKNIAARIWTSKIFKISNKVTHPFFEKLTAFITARLPEPQSRNDFLSRVQHHQGPAWSITPMSSILDLEGLIQSLSTGANRNSARYMHFAFTHFPVNFDENCVYKADDANWFKENQNEKGIDKLTSCGLKQAAAFLDQLKKLGIYDNSFIVIKSDHGQPVNFYSSMPNNLKINHHSLWGYNRYTPMLLVKNYKSRNKQIKTHNALVILDDLAQTICSNTQSKENCQSYPGINLLGSNLSIPRDLHIYITPNKNSTYMLDDLVALTIRKHQDDDFLKLLQQNDIELTT